MYSADKDVLARLTTGEKIIDQLTVEMITERFGKRMFKMSYGPSGVIALTTDRIIFVGSSDKRVIAPDTEWEVPLEDVRGAVYYPFTLQVFTRDQPMPGVRFPVVGFSRSEAAEWSKKVRDLVGPYLQPDRTGVVEDEWQVKRLVELRRQLRDGEISQPDFAAAKRRLLEEA